MSVRFRADRARQKLGDFGGLAPVDGTSFRQPADLAIVLGEQSKGLGLHFRRARPPLGLTGPLTLTNF